VPNEIAPMGARLLTRLALAALLLVPASATAAIGDAAFEKMIARTEIVRGLRFLEHPTFEIVAASHPRLATLRADAAAREPIPNGSPSDTVGRVCHPDFARARVICLAPPDQTQICDALARLLDAQHYPELVASAPGLRDDPGVAVRSLLAASAAATAGSGLGPQPDDPPDLLAQEPIEIRAGETAKSALVFAATVLLASQRDREAPFRAPPLSTKQLMSVRAYAAAEPPRLLVGAPPALDGCRVARDGSVGVGRLLVALTPAGGELPNSFLAAWQGDRGVSFACARGARAWLYAVDFADDAAAGEFAPWIDALLPAAFARPIETRREGRRVVAWHGVPASVASAWGAALRSSELRSLQALE